MSTVHITDEQLRAAKEGQQRRRNLSGIHTVAKATPGTPDSNAAMTRLLIAVFGEEE